MKKFKQVEKDRKSYHRDPSINGVHRSSLLVPQIDGCETEISFLNHFLIKRNYSRVCCRMTGIDSSGNRIQSTSRDIILPQVYSFKLSRMFERQAVAYSVEFFCADNLFVPFPAVMINHYGEGFVNTVHAYNRVLNDVFEDDAINLHNVAEASIDVEVSAQRDTFVIFQAGQFACDGTISFELMVNGDRYSAEKQISVPRFCCQQFFLSEIFALNEIKGGVLRVRQPQQNLFFGRILAGQKDLKSSAFSANHSYYDSSKVEEYWGESAASQRCYPFFPDLENRIRMYPIQSPSRIAMSLVAFDSYGEQIVRLNLGNISSPSSEFLDCNVTAALEERSVDIDSVSAFEVIAVADEGRVPTRINHQLIYGQKDALCASINVSLANPGEFSARGRQKMCWGQMVVRHVK